MGYHPIFKFPTKRRFTLEFAQTIRCFWKYPPYKIKRQIKKIYIKKIEKSGLNSIQILERIKLLLTEFKIAMPYYDFENSYIGPGLNLWISQDLFPMKLRGSFRSSLYGFNLDNNIDLGRAPIEFRETIRFEEFLEGPINLLHH